MKKSDFNLAMQAIQDADTYADVLEIYKYLAELKGIKKPTDSQLDDLFWMTVYRNPKMKGGPKRYKKCDK